MTTTTAPALAEGVTYADAWLYVQEAAPDLIATWQAARAAYDRHESGYQAGAVAWQRRAGAIRRRPRSEYAEALAVAEAMVAARLEGMIVEGAVVFAGVVRQQRASGRAAGPDPPVEPRGGPGGHTRSARPPAHRCPTRLLLKSNFS